MVYLGPDLPAADIAHAVRTIAEAPPRWCSPATAAGELIATATSRTLRRLPARCEIWAGGAHAAALRSALGSRARQVDSLEELQALV